MREGERPAGQETREQEPAFQYAEITYGAPGHELEYTMHLANYGHPPEKQYIPMAFEQKLKEYYEGSEHAIGNRGSRIEIHSATSKGWPEPRREDVMVYDAVNKALAEFAEEWGQREYRLGPYGWKRYREWLGGAFGEELADRAAGIAIYAAPEGIAETQAQHVYDLVESFWQLTMTAKRETEDDKLLEGETAEDRTKRNRKALEEILDEIEQARNAV